MTVIISCYYLLTKFQSEMRKINKTENKTKSIVFNSNIISLQDFSSRENDLRFSQFFSNFFKYLSSNFSLFYLYSIFIIYFPSNSLLLKFHYDTLEPLDFIFILFYFNLFSLILFDFFYYFVLFIFLDNEEACNCCHMMCYMTLYHRPRT